MYKYYLYIIILLQLPFLSHADTQFQNKKFLDNIQNMRINVAMSASAIPIEKLNKIISIKALNITRKCFRESAAIMPSLPANQRFTCLIEALNNDNFDIIWSLRGGYGSAQIIDDLLNSPKPKKEKIFIGYSDVTALHLFFTQEWGWKTIHGAVLKEIFESDKDTKNLNSIAELLKSGKKDFSLKDLEPLNKAAIEKSDIAGLVTGGNLTILETSLGTKWQINAKNKILFIEDVGVHHYQIDRSLLHLKQSGVLDEVKAIIFGSFDKKEESSYLSFLKKKASEYNIPIFKTNKIGHGKKNYPIIYNSTGTINKDSNNKYILKMKW